MLLKIPLSMRMTQTIQCSHHAFNFFFHLFDGWMIEIEVKMIRPVRVFDNFLKIEGASLFGLVMVFRCFMNEAIKDPSRITIRARLSDIDNNGNVRRQGQNRSDS